MSKKKDEWTYSYKIVMVGEAGVGKTSLIRRYVDNKFLKPYHKTLGCDFTVPRTISFVSGKINVILMIWDIAGDLRFSVVWDEYFRGASGAILVFEISNKKTLDLLPSKWIKSINMECKKPIPMVLLGNKNDLKNERKVTQKKAEEFAKLNNLHYYETSAKTGENVKEAFNDLAKQILKSTQNLDIDEMERIYEKPAVKEIEKMRSLL
jgi:Ras-related protein Rab-11A